MSQSIRPVTNPSTPVEVSTPPLDHWLRREIIRGTDAWPGVARALLTVLDLHAPMERAGGSLIYCAGCCPDCPMWWPCPTVEAIAEQLGVELEV